MLELEVPSESLKTPHHFTDKDIEANEVKWFAQGHLAS